MYILYKYDLTVGELPGWRYFLRHALGDMNHTGVLLQSQLSCSTDGKDKRTSCSAMRLAPASERFAPAGSARL